MFGRYYARGSEGSPIVTISIDQCRTCEHAIFPSRYRCPSCGSNQWIQVEVASGEILDVTKVRRRIGRGANSNPIALAAVRTTLGVTVIARADPEAERGNVVELGYDGEALTAYARSEEEIVD